MIKINGSAKKLCAIILTLTMVLGGLVIPATHASAAVEKPARGLMLYSSYTTTVPNIDGAITNANNKDWAESYVRNITMSQVGGPGVKNCDLLFINNATNLFVGVVYSDATADNADYFTLYFDMGTANQTDNDKLDKNNEDAKKYAPQTSTSTDYFWNGNAWTVDTTAFTAKAQRFGNMYNYEYNIPITGKTHNATQSDLQAAPTDMIGFTVELYDNVLGRFVWKETNGWNATISGPEKPDLGKSWGDLQLGYKIDRTIKSQYTATAPTMNDGIPLSGDNGWTNAKPKDISLTDYNGHTIPATIYTEENGQNLYLGAKVYDKTNTGGDKLTVYEDRNAGGGASDWQLSSALENAASIDANNAYTDMTYYRDWYPIATYQGNLNWWQNYNQDISFVAGKPNVQIRFRFNSDANNNMAGWYLDDIGITGDSTPIVSNNFDGPTMWGSFTHAGVNDDWALGNPAGGVGPGASHSPASCIGTNLLFNYANNEQSAVYSPVFDLSGYHTATLSYSSWLQTINGGWGGNDFGVVEVYAPQGLWVADSVVGDGTDGQGNAKYFDQTGTADDHYEFELRQPTNAGNFDLQMASGNTINFMLEYYDQATSTRYFWDQTSNDTTFLTETVPSFVSTVGWAQWETGYPYIAITDPVNNAKISGVKVVYSTAVDNANPSNVQDVTFSVDDGAWKVGTPDTQTQWYWNWNTTTLTEGAHLLKARATDYSTQQWITDNETVWVDNYQPTIQVNWPTQDDYMGGTSVLTATALETNGHVTTPKYSVDGGAWATMSVGALGKYTANWNTMAVADGLHTLTFVTWDESGNQATSTVRVVVDNTNPTCSVTYPMADQYVDGMITIKVRAHDNLALGAVNLSIDGANATQLASPQGDYYNLPINTMTLSNGLHSLVCNAVDKAGNIATSDPININIDNAPLLVQVTSPLNGEYISGLYQVRSMVSSEVALESVQVQFGGQTFDMLATTAYTYQLDTTTVADGNYTVSVTATDYAGRTTTVPVAVHVDNVPPVMTVAFPAVGAYIEGNVVPQATCTDLFLSACLYNVDGGEWLTQGPIDTTPYTDGPHTITFRALAASGHYTDLALPIIIDNTPPAIVGQFPMSDQYLEGKERFYVQVVEAVKVASVQFTIGDMTVDATYDPTDGQWESTIDTTVLADGDYNVVLSVKDGIGHVTKATPKVHVDNSIPVLKPSGPIEGSYMTGKMSLSANYTDILEYSIDGAAWVSASTPIDTTKLTDGSHLLAVRARDAAGHITEMELHVMVDNTAPSVEFVTPVAEQHIAGVSPYELTINEANLASIDVRAENMVLNVAMVSPYTGVVDTKNLTDGKHTITATVTDKAGHSTVAQVEVVVDNSAPVVATTVPEGKDVQGKIVFKLTVTDATSVDSVMIRIDQGKWEEAVLQQDGTYTYTLKTGVPDNGKHTYAIKTWDRLGNEKTYVYGFKVVNADYTWLLVLIIVLLVVVAIGLLLWKRKKGTADEDLGTTEDSAATDKEWAKDMDEEKDDTAQTKIDDDEPIKDDKKEPEMDAKKPEVKHEK